MLLVSHPRLPGSGAAGAEGDRRQRLVDVHAAELLAVGVEADRVVAPQMSLTAPLEPSLGDLELAEDAVEREHELGVPTWARTREKADSRFATRSSLLATRRTTPCSMAQ